MAKIPKLEKIMKEICNEFGVKEGVNIIMTKNPARIYFTFECGKDGFYLNTNRKTMKEVCKIPNGIADKYGLVRANSDPKYEVGGRVALGFKLKPYNKNKLKGGLK